jgi:hypothetical protein
MLIPLREMDRLEEEAASHGFWSGVVTTLTVLGSMAAAGAAFYYVFLKG